MSESIDEYYAVYNETQRRARKEHRCCACREPVVAGATYTVINLVFEGSAKELKRCARCQTLHEHLRTLGGGDMWPDEKLNCGEEYKDHWGKEPPEHIAALAFWRPGDPLPPAVPPPTVEIDPAPEDEP